MLSLISNDDLKNVFGGFIFEKDFIFTYFPDFFDKPVPVRVFASNKKEYEILDEYFYGRPQILYFEDFENFENFCKTKNYDVKVPYLTNDMEN